MPRLLLVSCFTLCCFVSTTYAQPPFLPRTGERAPDDNVEGTIWEYEGTLKGTPKEDEKDLELSGKFRIEGSAIFDVSPTFALPKPDQIKKTAKKIVEGKPVELKLPSAPQQKRLGEYKKISGGKLRLDFKDKDSLSGIMIIWPKPGTNGVWLGTFDQREGTKSVRSWQVELRAIQD